MLCYSQDLVTVSRRREVPPLAGWPCQEQAAAATNNSSSIDVSSPHHMLSYNVGWLGHPSAAAVVQKSKHVICMIQ
jgi:hypothetical protein